MTRRLLIIAAATLALAGCDSLKDFQKGVIDPVIQTQEVDVAVPVKCADLKIDMTPQHYADDTAADVLGAADTYAKGALVLKSNEQRKARLAVLEPAMRICLGLEPE